MNYYFYNNISFVIKTLLLVVMLSFFEGVKGQKYYFNTPDFRNTILEDIPISRSFVDSEGYYWMAGDGLGFVRYDGVRIEVYDLASKADYIGNIIEDPKGYLWVALHSKNLEKTGVFVSNIPITGKIISDSLKFVKQHQGIELLSESVHPGAFSINSNGELLVNSVQKLIKMGYSDEGEFYLDTIKSLPGNQEGGAFISSLILENGDLAYDVYPDKRVLHKNLNLENEEIVELANKKFSGSNLLHQDKIGKIWAINYYTGLQCFDPEDIENMETIDIKGGASRIAIMNDSTIMATNPSGIKIIHIAEDTTIQDIGLKEGLINSQIHGLHYNKGVVTLSTQHGITDFSVDFSAFKLFDKETILNGKPFYKLESIQGIFTDLKLGSKAKLTAIAGYNGMTIFDENYNFEVLSSDSEFIPDVITRVASDNDGRIWISHFDRDIVCIYPKEKKPKHLTNKGTIKLFGRDFVIGHSDFKANGIFHISLPPGQGKDSLELMVSSVALLNFIDNEGGILQLTLQNGFNNSSKMVDIKIDKNAFLYVTSDNGLYRTTKPWTRSYFKKLMADGIFIDSTNYTQVGGELFENMPLVWEGDTLKYTTNITLVENNLWLAYNNGIAIYSTDKEKIVDFISLDAGKSPSAFVRIDDMVWGCATTGLIGIDAITREQRRFIAKEDGLIDPRPYSIKCLAKDYSGNILLGTKLGVVSFDPERMLTDPTKMNCKIRDYVYNENNFGRNRLDVEFVGLDGLKTKSINYKYKLEGHDDDWSQSTKDTKVNYNNLSAFGFKKNYKFQLQAQSYDGDWAELEKPIEIEVKPALWSRWWALIAYFILGYVLIRKYLKYRLQQLQQKMLANEAQKIKEKNIVIEEKNAQNELLLKEIHHRVKNNLQTISSLLFLQSSGLNDDDAKDALKAVQQRVESMALIHRKLYEEDNLSKINMRGYIKLLIENLIDSFGLTTEQIELKVDVNNVELEMDQAIPVGLIINELITNVLKYAFPDRNGKIFASLNHQDEGGLVLYIKDNGIGKQSTDKKSFGSKLIDLLTRQMDGSFSDGNDDGYWTKIGFD